MANHKFGNLDENPKNDREYKKPLAVAPEYLQT